MNNPNKKRLRRTMMFLNAQKPGLIKDPYIYKPDSIMLGPGRRGSREPERRSDDFPFITHLKDYQLPRTVNVVVRINGLDSDPYWEEDIRCAVAGGCRCHPYPKDRDVRTGCKNSWKEQ